MITTKKTRIIPLPSVFKGKLLREGLQIIDVKTELTKEMDTLDIVMKIVSGQRIAVAVAVANQGTKDLVEIVTLLIGKLTSVGAKPFIIPVIDNGKGLSADEQKDVLEKMGITEKTMGVPIYSTMETILIGESPKGIPVFIDPYAYEADGIILLNRTTFHGGFSSKYKSGLLRRITIGLGKQSSVSMCRSYGSAHISENIAEVARFIVQATRFLFGIAVIENPYQETTHIKVVTSQGL